jgi:uncharacterized membrane protein
MAFCSKCGTQMGDDTKFCPSCGAPAGGNQQQQQQQYQQQQYQQYQQPGAGGQNPFQNVMNTADATGQFHPQDIAQNKTMSILAYIGLLVLVPLFAAKDSPYARFHSNQGLLLLICEVILGILSMLITRALFFVSWTLLTLFSVIFWLIGLALLLLAILGIVNVVNGKAKELPLIGKIKLIK